MDTNKVLEQINESGLVGPQFWYIYAIVVTSLLVLLITAVILLVKGFLSNFLVDIKETNGRFAESIEKLTVGNSHLTKMVELHDYQIKHLEEDVKDLSKRRQR